MQHQWKGGKMRHTGGTGGRGSRFLYVVAGIAALGGVLFGYDTGVISGAILFITQDFHLTSTMKEVVTSFVLVGAVVGAAAGGAMADRLGRRLSIILAAIVFTVGAIGTALVPNLTWLIAGRFVVGLAIGVASVVTPLYLAEAAPARIRGSLVSLNQLAITVGILVAYLVDYAFSGMRSWRWMFGLAAIPSLALGIGMLFMPRSPRWLIAKGRVDEGKDALKRIRARSDVSTEVKDIRTAVQQQSGGWRELLRPAVRMPLVIGVSLAIFQQATGINTVIYYAPTIFQFAGFSTAGMAIFASLAVAITNVVMTTVAVWLLDRVGRRPLLLIGLVGMVIALGALGYAFESHALAHLIGWIAVGSLVLYVGSFAVSLGPAFWLLISELYPLKVRGLAMGLATVVNWGMNLLVAVTFLTLTQMVGKPMTFWIYAAVGVAAWLFIFFLVPETKGRTLEQIEEHWRAGRHPRAMGRPET